MRLTNNYGYPSCIVAMAKASLSRPVDGIIRVTSLIGPTAIRYYQLHNWDDIVVDVDEFIQSGFGTAWHRYLASFASSIPELYSEQTLQIEDDGIVISGTPDIRLVDAIEDIKVTSAWSFVFAKPEWEAQLNTYALLASANGFPISSLRINAFLRDWSALNYMRYNRTTLSAHSIVRYYRCGHWKDARNTSMSESKIIRRDFDRVRQKSGGKRKQRGQ